MWGDAVVLFDPTDRVNPEAIGSLAICRKMDGEQILARVERARNTGEATVRGVADSPAEVTLDTASPVIAVIP